MRIEKLLEDMRLKLCIFYEPLMVFEFFNCPYNILFDIVLAMYMREADSPDIKSANLKREKSRESKTPLSLQSYTCSSAIKKSLRITRLLQYQSFNLFPAKTFLILNICSKAPC